MFVILVRAQLLSGATMRLKLRGDFLHCSFHMKGLREHLPGGA